MCVPTITPVLRYRDVQASAKWLCQAFGFQRLADEHAAEGVADHISLRFGDDLLLLCPYEGSAFDDLLVQPGQIGGQGTQSCYLTVADVETHYANAQMNGAVTVLPPERDNDGNVFYICRDPEGHLWSFGTRPYGGGSARIVAKTPSKRSRPARTFLHVVLAGLVFAAAWLYLQPSEQAVMAPVRHFTTIFDARGDRETQTQAERRQRKEVERQAALSAKQHAEAQRELATLSQQLGLVRKELATLRRAKVKTEEVLRATRSAGDLQLQDKEQRLAALSKAYKQAQAELTKSLKSAESTALALKSSKERLAEGGAERARLAELLNQARLDIQHLKASQLGSQQALAKAMTEREQAQQDLAQAKERAKQARLALQTASQRLDEARRQTAALRQKQLTQRDAERTRLAKQLKQARLDIQHLKDSKLQSEQALTRVMKEKVRTQKDLTQAKEQAKQSRLALQVASQRLDEARRQHATLWEKQLADRDAERSRLAKLLDWARLDIQHLKDLKLRSEQALTRTMKEKVRTQQDLTQAKEQARQSRLALQAASQRLDEAHRQLAAFRDKKRAVKQHRPRRRRCGYDWHCRKSGFLGLHRTCYWRKLCN